MGTPAINREYKDRLFRLLFGTEEHKADLLELYNALAGTNYANEADLQIVTIDDVIYMSMKNDTSFILESILSLFEQQSSFNPNMPLRGLIYFSRQYDSIVKQEGKNIFGHKLVKIPTPRYYVFYNGEEERADRETLRLSDAFQTDFVPGEYEWTATMININKGHNDELMAQCGTLREYAEFIAYIREKKRTMDIRDAMHLAIDKFKKREGTLAEFLIKHEAEVMDVCITEYDEQATLNSYREEGREEGFEEGKLCAIIQLIKANMPKSQIVSIFSETEYNNALKKL